MNILGKILSGGYSNPSKKAMQYVSQIPQQTLPYMQPFYSAGVQSLQPLQEQYSQLYSDPGAALNRIGESFQQSPGYKFALEQALQQSGARAAANGMLGSPAHSRENMELASGLANQDYWNHVQRALGLYGTGLQGAQNLASMGQQSGQDISSNIAKSLSQQGNLAYQNAQYRNDTGSNITGSLAKALGAFLTFNPY